MNFTESIWQGKLQKYAQEKWSQQPSLFAQSILQYLPKTGKLLELGAGLGQDGLWFTYQGFSVTQTDLVTSEMLPNDSELLVKRQVVDLGGPLPFPKQSFDIVYAHLSLHYFAKARTETLFGEIYTALKPSGVFAMLVNSVHDSEIGEGKQLEKNFYEVDGIRKRYFDLDITKELTQPYIKILLDDHGTSYKDREKGLNNLIQFVGRKA